MNRRGFASSSLHARARFVCCIGMVLALLAVTWPAGAWGDGAPASLVLGQANFTSNTQITTQSGMYSPFGVAVDPTTGKVFVADTYNHRVLRFASLATLANGAPAEGVLGQTNFTSRTAATTASGMNYPYGIAVDSAGRLWVADNLNNRVLRFDSAASKDNGANADRVLGQADFTSRTAATTQAGMNLPNGVAVDSAGRLWVADGNNCRVLRFDAAANKDSGANADGVLGQLNFTSSGMATTQSGMYAPFGVAMDGAGRLWVSDPGNSRVLRFDSAASLTDGAPASGVLGQADFTSRDPATTQSGMAYPFGVAVDSTGRLWVADQWNSRVLRFDAAAGKANGANADGVLGQADFTSRTIGATQSRTYNPYGVAVDGADRLWVADGNGSRVLLFAEAVQTQITRAGASPTNAANVTFQVSFDAPVSGLAASNFSLTTSGTISGASVTQVTPGASASVYTVTVTSGTGDGTLRLDLDNATGLAPQTVLPSLPYTGGEVYTIDKTAPAAPRIDTPAANSYANVLRPVIRGGAGAAEAGATVTVREGTNTLCTATAAADGSWSCTPGADLAEGAHTLLVTQTDLAGNEPAEATRSFTIRLQWFLFLPTILR